jgi:hypothetical protein
MEDGANSCSAVTTLLSKKLWVRFWTTFELADWTLAIKVFSSFTPLGGCTDLDFTLVFVGRPSVDYGKKSKLERSVYSAPQVSVAFKPYNWSSLLTPPWNALCFHHWQ